MAVNTVVVRGRVYRYAERNTSKGNSVGAFSIGFSNGVKGGGSSYINVEIWEPSLALSDLLNSDRGEVLVVGKLRQDQWEDKDGQRRSTVKIVANTVTPVPEENPSENEASPPTPAQEPRSVRQQQRGATPARASQPQKPALRRSAPPPPPPVEEMEDYEMEPLSDDNAF